MPDLSLFTKYLKEAPEDSGEAPDADMGSGGDPPDIQSESNDDVAPDIDDSVGDDFPAGDLGTDDTPPDIGDDAGSDEGFDDFSGDDESTDEQSSVDVGLDDKVSAIMNMNLYQRYLSLLNTIASQTTMIKNNSDILHTISPESLDIIDSLKKLDENIRLYIKNTFINENYSRNLLFFNKCLNLLKLLNDIFEKNVNKGISSVN